MEPVFLKNPINNAPDNDTESDLNAPFSFLEWRQRRPFFIEKKALFQYNKYVLDWFDDNKTKTLSQKFLLRQRYLYLLDQLQLFFSEKEKYEWYNKIDLMNEKELLMTIPYFARKLKQIALYYLNLRKKLKNTKLKYNTVGTAFGVEQDLYNAIINGFSSLSNELDPDIKAAVPELSSITQSLVIQVEELYDDKDYFDVSPNLPVTDRFNIFHDATLKYYQTKGINLSSEEWILNCLSLSANLDFDSFVNTITGNIFETTDADLYKGFVAQYLGENKFVTSFGELSSDLEITRTLIQPGHNYFYYPKGVTDPTVLFEKKLKNISLSALQIEEATAGITLEDADTIFVKNGSDIKGAWLRYEEFNDTEELLEAKLNQYGSTTFIFPYPGYGLSGEEITWTGPSLFTTPEYEFLSNTLRSSINESYWSQEIGENTLEQLPINSTTLLSSGAIPNTNPNFADKISIRTNNSSNLDVPAFILSGSWLYKFEKALFPISTIEDNRFLWPYTLIDSNVEYPNKFTSIDFSKICEPVNISDLNSSYSIGSDNINTSDKIYKFEKYSDDTTEAIECCWLSSAPVTLTNHKSFVQNGFNALFETERVEKFVWNGPNNTPLDEVFKSTLHKNDCPYVTNASTISALEWEKCNCRHVYYSPFGHPGNLFDDYNGFADFIVKDPSNGTRDFDMDSWRFIDGSSFRGSQHVAWYKTDKLAPDWGYGRWVNNSSVLSPTPFLLQTGQSYYYKRAKSKQTENSMPPYSVNYVYNTANKGVWIGARLNENQEWISSDLKSNLVIRPGDVIKYERAAETTQYLLSSEIVENVPENRGSVWSTLDYVVSGSPQSTNVYISWPSDEVPVGGSASQYPPFGVSDVQRIVSWKIQHTTIPSINATYTNNKTIIPFIPTAIGTYSITASAIDTNGNGYHATNIPSISVVPLYESKEFLIKQGTKSNGFLLEQPLFGWNYLENKPSLQSTGAKPFWAELYIGKQTENKFKGAFSWGYPNKFIDGYIPDHAPVFSSLILNFGETVTYERVGPELKWVQPIVFKNQTGTSTWCKLSTTTNEFSNLSAIYASKSIEDLNVYPLTEPTDIELTNVLNGFPVEIFYYALKSFTWTLSTELNQTEEDPTQELFLKANTPWSNIGNRFYSTVASIPLLDELYTESNVGGYFIPQNLGASMAINKDFTTMLKSGEVSGSYLVEDLNVHVGGRGRTKQDQKTLYTWEEQNQWMKEPSTANRLAGSVKKNLTKILQTFVPYQEGSEETSLGLITPKSRVSPWGQRFADTWTDYKNEPRSFTGVINISAWVDSQVLKKNQLVVDNWTTDIFGNQYSLFKNLTNVPVSERRSVPGILWTKLNNQLVQPARESLNGIFEPFKNNSFYHLLTGEGILSIDCFFDTLMFETSSTLIFSQIEYDYENAKVLGSYDSSIVIDNLNKSNLRFEKTWLHSNSKEVVVLFTTLSGTKFVPELYNLNSSDNSYNKIFPLKTDDLSNIQAGLSGIEVGVLDPVSMHYNSTQQTYLLTYKGTDIFGRLFIVDFKIERSEDMILKEIDRYLNTSAIAAILDPPEIINPTYFNTFNVLAGISFSIPLSAENDPTNWSIVSTHPFPISVDNNGVFGGIINTPGTYFINYKVSNRGGAITYPLTIKAT